MPQQNGAGNELSNVVNTQSVTQPGSPAQGPTLIAVEGAETVVVPNGTLILDAEYSRSGADLILTAPDGDVVRLQDYFQQEIAPDLMTEGGAVINAAMATRLAGPLAPGQYAQATDTDVLGQPIGQIEGLEGRATATRADGTQVTLQDGDPVFADDIIETGPDGALGVVFVDKSTMSMSEDGRIILDDMVYDPDTNLGMQAFNVVRGAFVFASGIIGKNDPDSVSVTTPVATIGIRGTKYGIDVAAIGGETTVTLFEGAVAVGNSYGQSILSGFGDTSQVASSLTAPSDVFVLDEQGQQETYGRALTLHPPQPPIDRDELNDGDRTENEGGGLDVASGPGGGGVGDQAFLSEFDNSVAGNAPDTDEEDDVLETVPPIRETAGDTDTLELGLRDSDDDLQVTVGGNVFDLDDAVSIEIGGNGEDTLTATRVGPEVLVGANAEDTLIGNDATDLLLGGRSDDLMRIAAETLISGELGQDVDYSAVVSDALAADDSLEPEDFETSGANGGQGKDTVQIWSSDPVVLAEEHYDGLKNIEELDLTDLGDGSEVSLSLQDVIDITDDENALWILHDGSLDSLTVGEVDVSAQGSYQFNWDGKAITVITDASTEPDSG